ncbi:MFS transporter [Amycolatopsis sp. NPDC049868]|uniref:MFS transporter n=1 Tax=Amycolatopsis sp. NPDC049868 TaxID=3363934 RepID=UPI00379D39C0
MIDEPVVRTTPKASKQLVMLLVAAFGALSGFYLLVSVVPLYIADSGSGGFGAGLATGAMMLATVVTELAVPRLVARLGYRAVFALGQLLLGVPALALIISPATGLTLGVSLVRGAGLGIVVVVGSALAAELAPARRRAEGLAIYGVVVGVPAVVGLPAGIWLSEQFGFAATFAVAAVVSLSPLAVVSSLPSKSGDVTASGSVLRTLRAGGLARLTVVFTAITIGAGVFATFLPLAVSAEARGTAALALLVQSLAMSAARFAAGRFGDRHGSGRLLVPSVLVSAVGAALLSWTDSSLLMVAGMALFGAGFGVAQNVTLTLMIERVDVAEYGNTSALWNLAYDAGFGLGAVGFGLLTGPFGYGTGFALTAVVLLTALVPAILDRKVAKP